METSFIHVEIPANPTPLAILYTALISSAGCTEVGDDSNTDTTDTDTTDTGSCGDRDEDGTCDEDDLCPDNPAKTDPSVLCGCETTSFPEIFVQSTETLGEGTGELWKIFLGDLDGDDDLDAALGFWGPDQVWKNDSTGAFTLLQHVAAGTKNRGVDVGDVDGDGMVDIAIANNDNGPGQIWLNSCPE